MFTTSQLAAPTAVFVQHTSTGALRTARGADGHWVSEGAVVTLTPAGTSAADLALASTGPLSRVVLRWETHWPAGFLVCGDAWERSYGDLQWRGLQAERLLPWSWLGHDRATGETTGLGVDVQPRAFCAWTVDADGVSLSVDVRNGGGPVLLGDRPLAAATLRLLTSAATPWRTAQAAAAAMSAHVQSARPAIGPVVGANNWYYAYGQDFDAEAVLVDARTVVELIGDHPVRPFSVIDDGWNIGGEASGGPWDAGDPTLFPDMAETAAAITAAGARPGLWFRPLLSREPFPGARASWDIVGNVVLDPSDPVVLERVADDLRRFAGWGYELVKHDFSTFDLFGRFAPAMGAEMTDPDHRFADVTKTTAEIVLDLYRTVREATDLVVIGCNTVNHLAAGLVDVQRTGDDTSGRVWERTRRMGVNTLAYRLPQHGSFFTVDADCVPCTDATPWALNRQFLDVIARSGTALFVSVDPKARTAASDADLTAALRLALDGGTPGGIEPLDWLDSTTPVRWADADGEHTYRWTDPWGAGHEGV